MACKKNDRRFDLLPILLVDLSARNGLIDRDHVPTILAWAENHRQAAKFGEERPHLIIFRVAVVINSSAVFRISQTFIAQCESGDARAGRHEVLPALTFHRGLRRGQQGEVLVKYRLAHRGMECVNAHDVLMNVPLFAILTAFLPRDTLRHNRKNDIQILVDHCHLNPFLSPYFEAAATGRGTGFRVASLAAADRYTDQSEALIARAPERTTRTTGSVPSKAPGSTETIEVSTICETGNVDVSLWTFTLPI